MQFSNDGALFIIVDSVSGMHIYSTVTQKLQRTIARPNIVATYISPRALFDFDFDFFFLPRFDFLFATSFLNFLFIVGTYLLTWERFSEANENKNNLLIWRIATGEM